MSIDAFAVFTLFQKNLCARLTSTQKKNESLEICILKLIQLTNEIKQNCYSPIQWKKGIKNNNYESIKIDQVAID